MPLPAELPTLAGPRLVLRPLREADAPALLAIVGDPEVMRFASDPPFDDLDGVARMLASVRRLLAAGEAIEWGIVFAAEDRVIGTCGLHGFSADGGRAEVGCLVARAAWRQGVATEALGLLADWARAALPTLDTLVADIDAPNVASRALFAALGFRPAGGTLHERPLR